MGLKEWIVPQDHRFFDKLDAIAENGVRAAEALKRMLDAGDDMRVRAERIKGFEHQGDEYVHDMYELLNRSFITPIDHGDLAMLVTALDDFVDFIDSSASRLTLYGVAPTEGMRSLGSLILRQSGEIHTAIEGLRKLREPEKTERACIEIHSLENAADSILTEALVSLFKENDAITIIKHKEIYENLETATDKAEDVANIIGDIVMKST